MPVPIIAAGIGAATSVAKGVSSGKGAKKAAQIQAQSAAQQRALQERVYNQNANNFRGDIQLGDAASARQAALLGLAGGDGSNPTEVLRATPGYEFRFGEMLRGQQAGAYANGMGTSGAAMKQLQDRSMGLADQTFNTYFDQTGQIANRGVAAKSSLAGVSTNWANTDNKIAQGAADSNRNFAMFKANNFNNTLDGVTKAFGSSFGGK
ncbi:hypothetical protein OKW76_00485 [Sphingomonas sp. S1-29]|uniref:hypothetical protein n=1 Tax=Sphingomonas sp. S1-29 TaxID=2991074 RepID=UPI002240AE92|nr:hypothetical protein [Sphingomonas sp. S1-29]UZK69602.1 hypothetical protein OKW76_00485 [Sphingomonas sp. S1-29]